MNTFHISFDENIQKFNISFKEDISDFKISFGEFSVKYEGEITPEKYSGPMEVTPMNYSQELATADKYVADNIFIDSVPYSVTTNLKNGKTITIGV